MQSRHSHIQGKTANVTTCITDESLRLSFILSTSGAETADLLERNLETISLWDFACMVCHMEEMGLLSAELVRSTSNIVGQVQLAGNSGLIFEKLRTAVASNLLPLIKTSDKKAALDKKAVKFLKATDLAKIRHACKTVIFKQMATSTEGGSSAQQQPSTSTKPDSPTSKSIDMHPSLRYAYLNYLETKNTLKILGPRVNAKTKSTEGIVHLFESWWDTLVESTSGADNKKFVSEMTKAVTVLDDMGLKESISGELDDLVYMLREAKMERSQEILMGDQSSVKGIKTKVRKSLT
jgi:hypothetical protein